VNTKAFILFLIAMLPGVAMASAATSAMAGVLGEINHFPSDAHVATLDKIAASDASAVEKQLAQIITRIAHQPGPDDKAALQKIIDMGDAAPATKVIASAILNMNHKPQAADLAALKALK
jgi:hypothetical protein